MLSVAVSGRGLEIETMRLLTEDAGKPFMRLIAFPRRCALASRQILLSGISL